jgi:hypothetical protein
MKKGRTVRDPHRSPPILSDHVRVATTFDDRTIAPTTIARVRTFQGQSESDHSHLTTNPFGLLFSKNKKTWLDSSRPLFFRVAFPRLLSGTGRTNRPFWLIVLQEQ